MILNTKKDKNIVRVMYEKPNFLLTDVFNFLKTLVCFKLCNRWETWVL